MYEQTRKFRTTPGASLAGDSTLGRGGHASGSRPEVGRDPRRGFPMEDSACPRRRRSVVRQAGPRCHAEADRQTMSAVVEVFAARAAQARLVDRTLDATANRPIDREKVFGPVRPVRRMAFAAATWLELPEAGTESTRARRCSHRAVAQARLAALKKTLEIAAAPWYSSMNRALCCSRPCVALGLPGERRPCWTAGIGTTVCRSSRSLPSLRSAGGWASISTSWITTSSRTILKCLSLACCSGWAGQSSWSWIVGPSIERARGDSKNDSAAASMWNGCPPMRRSLIPMNRFGTTRNTPTWPTSFPRTSCTSGNRLPSRFVAHEATKPCCDPSSNMQNSNFESISFQVKGQ